MVVVDKNGMKLVVNCIKCDGGVSGSHEESYCWVGSSIAITEHRTSAPIQHSDPARDLTALCPRYNTVTLQRWVQKYWWVESICDPVNTVHCDYTAGGAWVLVTRGLGLMSSVSMEIHSHFSRLRCCPCPILWRWQMPAWITCVVINVISHIKFNLDKENMLLGFKLTITQHWFRCHFDP